MKKWENCSKVSILAVKLLNSVRSNYLETMMMNTPSFHHPLPLEIAVQSELVEVLSSDCIDRIDNALWRKLNLIEQNYERCSCNEKDTKVTETMLGDTNAWYSNVNRSTFATFLAAIGKPECAKVSESKKDLAKGRGIDNNTSEERAFANQMIVEVFSVVGLVLLSNLFIATMADSYATNGNSSSKEVLLNKLTLAAPFNVFIFTFFNVYGIDFSFFALTNSLMNETWTKQWRFRNPKCLF